MKAYNRSLFTAALIAVAVGNSFGQTSPAGSFSESASFNSQVGNYLKERPARNPVKPSTRELGDEISLGPISLSVSVLDADGRPVTDLTEDDFSVTVDGSSSKAVRLEKVQQPQHVMFLLDVSPSSQDLFKLARSNALALLEQLPQGTRVSLATFSSKFDLKLNVVTDLELVKKRIEKIRDFENGTAFYDAMKILVEMPQGPTAIVVITDGQDTTSRSSLRESLQEVERAGFAVYPVYIDSYSRYQKKIDPYLRYQPGNKAPGPTMEEAQLAIMYLNDLAALTGGRPVAATEKSGESPFSLVAELASRYRLTFTFEGKHRVNQRVHIKVRVARPNLTVLTRTSYIAGKLSR